MGSGVPFVHAFLLFLILHSLSAAVVEPTGEERTERVKKASNETTKEGGKTDGVVAALDDDALPEYALTQTQGDEDGGRAPRAFNQRTCSYCPTDCEYCPSGKCPWCHQAPSSGSTMRRRPPAPASRDCECEECPNCPSGKCPWCYGKGGKGAPAQYSNEEREEKCPQCPSGRCPWCGGKCENCPDGRCPWCHRNIATGELQGEEAPPPSQCPGCPSGKCPWCHGAAPPAAPPPKGGRQMQSYNNGQSGGCPYCPSGKCPWCHGATAKAAAPPPEEEDYEEEEEAPQAPPPAPPAAPRQNYGPPPGYRPHPPQDYATVQQPPPYTQSPPQQHYAQQGAAPSQYAQPHYPPQPHPEPAAPHYPQHYSGPPQHPEYGRAQGTVAHPAYSTGGNYPPQQKGGAAEEEEYEEEEQPQPQPQRAVYTGQTQVGNYQQPGRAPTVFRSGPPHSSHPAHPPQSMEHSGITQTNTPTCCVISLPPGRYSIHPQPPGGPSRRRKRDVLSFLRSRITQ